MTIENDEYFVSVDIEASGPVPGLYSMVSFGACAVDDDSVSFERILKPINRNFIPEAMAVTGFDLDRLALVGDNPQDAIKDFQNWVEANAKRKTPVFVGLNAAFDWAFVNYYFHLYSLVNPFGFAPVDIKALYMGRFNSRWKDATSKKMGAALAAKKTGNHSALVDARAQAELFRLIMSDRR
jgi:DNA polymerase III alpha subunit (gram-positive type)